MDKARLEWTESSGVHLLHDPIAEKAGLTVVFSTRRGGVSAAPYDTLNLSHMVDDEPASVDRNRAALATAAGFEVSAIALAKQVHGDAVVEVESGSGEPVGECDALLTSHRGVAVGVLTADCVPVLLTDGDRIAAVHAGWRGLVGGVIEAAVGRMRTITAAWVGPSIHACCYEVGPEVVAAFRERSFPVAAEDRVDPGRAAVVALRRAGVDNLAASDLCTSCEPSFFSYRRDGTTGRQGAFIHRRASS